MATMEDPPEEKLLLKIKETLGLLDFPELTGATIKTIRHFRSRFPLAIEEGTISIQFLGSTDIDGPDTPQPTMWERQKLLEVNLMIDLPLKPEKSGDDPTGWKYHLLVAAACVDKLKEEGSPIRDFADQVTDGDAEADPDSKPTQGRLVKAISVVYRVLAEKPSTLLAQGEMG